MYLDQKLTQNAAKIILYYHTTKQSLDWSSAFDFRICLGKVLIAFGFNEKLTPSVAQITMQYHVSKEFLRLHFAVDKVLSFSGYDLQNRRMPCKQKY